MRNIKIKSEQKSGKSKGWTIAVVGACVLMAGAAGITIRNAVAYNDGSDAQVPAEGQVSVAVANTEIMSGDTLSGNCSFELRDAELVPSDAISQGYDFNGAVMSIDAKPNTVLTDSMIVRPDLDETDNETSRFVSVNYVTLDSGVTEGDFIDIRLRKYGTEEGFVFSDDVVLAKKKVQSVSGKTVTLSLSEQEQMALSVAAVDASSYGRKSTETALLYCTRYVDASQTAAVETYSNATLSELIDSNPNIIAEAQRELAEQQQAQAAQEAPTMQDASGVPSSE